jgi:hypothetical protein
MNSDFNIIYYLVKELGLTLKGAKKKIKENKESTINNYKIVKSLDKIKSVLIEIREEL